MVGPLGTECCHLARKILEKLQKCGAVREWDNVRECRLGCSLGDAGCGDQAALGLASEDDHYVGWWGIRPDHVLRRRRLGRGS